VAIGRRPSRNHLASGVTLFTAGVLALGCNAILGVDQDFVLGPTSTGTTTTTSSAGAGGSVGGSGGTGVGASGGVGASAGHGGSTGSGGIGGQGGQGGMPGWTVVETLTVPSDGSVVTSNTVLQNGVDYHLRASGTFNMNTNQNVNDSWMADAEYYDFSNLPTSAKDHALTYDIGIAVDDPVIDTTKTPSWGAFEATHVYEIVFTGAGATIAVNFHDQVTSDNDGSLTLEILAWQ
jgi:hypothetical protein